MNARIETKVAVVLVVLAAALAFVRLGSSKDGHDSVEEVPKGKVASLISSERLSSKERIKRLRYLLSEKESEDLTKEDYDLIRGLSEEALMELLDEYSADSNRSYLMLVMFQRLGEIAGSDGIDWAIELDEVTSNGIRGLIAMKMMEGWARRDPVGALTKAFDPDFYSIVSPANSLSGDPVFRPPNGLVAKSAVVDPETTWELLLRGRRKELGKDFFEKLSPQQAKDYAKRIPELLADPERPGFELFGGFDDDPGANRTTDALVGATTAAAKAWFVSEPDKALAWYLKELPLPDKSVSGIGGRAGQLIGRLAVEKPDQAMEWARSQTLEIRRGLATGLADALNAKQGAHENSDPRLEEVVGWMDETQRKEWPRKDSSSGLFPMLYDLDHIDRAQNFGELGEGD
jgi:hypothetical protein